MAPKLRLCLCLLIAFAFICSARNTISLSGDELMVVAAMGRSLKVSTDDYSDPSANRGHDPRNRVGGSRSRDTP